MKPFAFALTAATLIAGQPAIAAPHSGPTGIQPTFNDHPSLQPPAPREAKLVYDPTRGKYCVTLPNGRGRINPSRCRSAEAWNRSGVLANPIG